MKNFYFYIPAIWIMLLTCAGACSKNKSRSESKSGHITLDLNSIKVGDTIRFDLNTLKSFPQSVNSSNDDYGFSYADQSFYYIKTLNENQAQYAVVKCDLNNKEIAVADISTYVTDFIKTAVDSGLCKSWQACYGFDLETFNRSEVLTIHYTGDVKTDWSMSHVVVFDPSLKTITHEKNVDPEHYLAETKFVTGSDSLFLRDLKGTELINYESTPSIRYQAKENELILCDRNNGSFYKGLTSQDTLSIQALPGSEESAIKIYGLEKTSAPLFIHHGLLFLSHQGNLYKIDLRSLTSAGYRITPETYNVYPNANGFFCDYPAFGDPGSDAFKHAYSFIPFTDPK